MSAAGFFPFAFKKSPKPLPKNQAPRVRSKTLPGPQSQKLAEQLKRYECPQVTYVGGVFPVFLHKGKGANLFDLDGNRYLDMTSSFGVCSLGYGNTAIIEAVRRQSLDMLHGMGDVHPNAVKIELAKKLAEITPGNLSQSFFSSTGSEAVETALKTAVMATGKTGVIAFDGAYHGLNYGALHVTHREDFRAPFARQLGKHAQFAIWPDTRLYGNKATEISMKSVRAIAAKAKRSPHRIGAVIVEPIQARGGVRVPPQDFLKELRAFCDQEGALLILDEIFTGFGRTGMMFACEKSGVVPDLMCLGKALSGGLPLSVCIGSARTMHAWGPSKGDAIHTSTYLGHPLGCAAALAAIAELDGKKLVERSRRLGEVLRRDLYKLKEKHSLIGDIRGAGLLIGVELNERPAFALTAAKPSRSKTPQGPPPASEQARRTTEGLMQRGILALTCGAAHNVIQLAPPFVLTEEDAALAVKALDEVLKKIV
ncbi:MAG: 5-aminovalerate aminotransferase DavT [Candidatus Omnitrophica bacterium]|nr:5-aminovalerate aminotransferase DavT [Candidatus Omnitrophota bacterium]